MPDTPTAKVETKTQYVRAVLEKEIGSARAFVVLQAVYEEAAAELESVRADRDRLAATIERVWQLALPDPSSVLVRMDMIRRTVQPYLSAPEEGSNDV